MHAPQIENAPDQPGSLAAVMTLASACFSCQLSIACPPCGLAGIDKQHHHVLKFSRHRLRAGEALYRKGDDFLAVHAVRSGSLKSSLTLADGRAQVGGFHFPGDILGFDGVADGTYQTTAVALEDTQTCAVPYDPLLALSARLPLVQRDLNRLMSLEVARGRWHMLLLGNMSAPERLAALLLDLSRRAAARGYAANEFNLRMTRNDIGSYLGITAETVCRTLRDFKAMNFLEVDIRRIRFLDLPGFARTYSATVN